MPSTRLGQKVDLGVRHNLWLLCATLLDPKKGTKSYGKREQFESCKCDFIRALFRWCDWSACPCTRQSGGREGRKAWREYQMNRPSSHFLPPSSNLFSPSHGVSEATSGWGRGAPSADELSISSYFFLFPMFNVTETLISSSMFESMYILNWRHYPPFPWTQLPLILPRAQDICAFPPSPLSIHWCQEN